MTSDGPRRGPQKKQKSTKAELLEAAKAKQEAVKALEGTKEGRVCGSLLHLNQPAKVSAENLSVSVAPVREALSTFVMKRFCHQQNGCQFCFGLNWLSEPF